MDEKVIEKVKVRAMSSLLHRNVLGALGMLLFALLAFNIGWLFTRGQNELNNKSYKVCSQAMIFVMVLFVLLSIVRACGVNIPGFLTMIVEAVLLLIFGFCLAGEGQTV